MERRTALKFGGLAAVVLGLIGIGGTALARRGGFGCHGNRAEFMKRMVSGKIDDALDYAKVEGRAREQVYAARDRVFAALAEAHADRGEHLQQVLELWQADTIDRGKVDALRAERQARMQKVGDAITQGIIDAHDALTPEQRKAVAEYVQKQRARYGVDEEKETPSP